MGGLRAHTGAIGCIELNALTNEQTNSRTETHMNAGMLTCIRLLSHAQSWLSGWLVVMNPKREWWRSTTVTSGAASAMTTGDSRKPLWCVDSWDTPQPLPPPRQCLALLLCTPCIVYVEIFVGDFISRYHENAGSAKCLRL